MRVLFIHPGGDLARRLPHTLSEERLSEIALDTACGATEGLARLRDHPYDAVLVAHRRNALDALQFVEGLRGGGSDEPVIVIGEDDPQQMMPLCYEAGADTYCHLSSTTPRALIWSLARGIERNELARENRRLVLAEQQRLKHEHREAERLLNQQRSLISDLESLSRGAGPAADGPQRDAGNGGREDCPARGEPLEPGTLSEELARRYRELLRAYVIMGTGNLADELADLVELLASAGVTARQTMQLHVDVVEELIHGLGNRSARHVMNRADLLVLELMVHLAEGYRRHYHGCVHPPRQRWLPGFA